MNLAKYEWPDLVQWIGIHLPPSLYRRREGDGVRARLAHFPTTGSASTRPCLRPIRYKRMSGAAFPSKFAQKPARSVMLVISTLHLPAIIDNLRPRELHLQTTRGRIRLCILGNTRRSHIPHRYDYDLHILENLRGGNNWRHESSAGKSDSWQL